MGVLKRIAIRISACRAPTAEIAGQKIRERIKIQTTAIAGIEKLADRSTTKLVTEFQIVTRQLPGKVVDQLIVDVSASARHRERCADVGDAKVVMNTNERQAKILRVCGSRVQTN